MGISSSKDHLLFTPGPLTTSYAVKQAMLRDLGSRDSEFLEITESIRKRILKIAGVGNQYTTILLQGSGTYGVEAVISSTIPQDGKLLVVSNGAYGNRIAQIAKALKIDHHVLNYAENQKPILKEIETRLEKDPQFTHVAVVHCETTAGIMNPIREIGQICHRLEKTYIVDAMSSFGAVPIHFEECHIDYLISSANKCLEGVPGFSFVIAIREKLEQTEHLARSLSFDLYSQWVGFEKGGGEFRFTPPIQTILAFNQALNELDDEGGVIPRSFRYQENHHTLMQGMAQLGFQTYLPKEDLGYLITSFRYLDHPRFQYKEFYERIRQRGYVIYSGKVSNAACFRVGNIGRLFKSDIQNLLSAIRETLIEMQIIP
jgi:2-aminoethylphosphonate-pyruvate transaminase